MKIADFRAWLAALDLPSSHRCPSLDSTVLGQILTTFDEDFPKPAQLPGGRRMLIAVRPAGGGEWCLCDDWAIVGEMIGSEDGSFDFEFRSMTEEEIEALPEFGGW